MPILYKPIERHNPFQPEEVRKHYPIIINRGELTMRQLGERISQMSTVSVIDTMAVLEAMLQVIPEELMDSNIVRLGDFGSFFLTFNSEGREREDQVDASSVKAINFRFRPGRLVKGKLKTAEYTRERKSA
jgi:predicted histone-like DNA-binding protein